MGKSTDAADFTQQILEQYNELAQLAGALAHEIKNPLSVIRMNVDLLVEDYTDERPPDQRRILNKIRVVQQQCERLQNLLDDFLKFARLRNLELVPGNLNEHAERVLEMFAPQARVSGIHIVKFLDADLPSILLDEQTLNAALVNLVKNAIEAMPEGGRLELRTRLTRTGVALDLIDTGLGMDHETLLHMFDNFYSTKYGGSGLGLPTAKKVIEAHHGNILVQSALDRGTVITLEFPTPARIQSSVATLDAGLELAPGADPVSGVTPPNEDSATDLASASRPMEDAPIDPVSTTDDSASGESSADRLAE